MTERFAWLAATILVKPNKSDRLYSRQPATKTYIIIYLQILVLLILVMYI